MHAYLMQFIVGVDANFETDELKEINHFGQQNWVQIICTNTNYKFGDYSFIENAKYCNTIEKTNTTIEATKATNKNTNHGTNYEKI